MMREMGDRMEKWGVAHKNGQDGKFSQLFLIGENEGRYFGCEELS